MHLVHGSREFGRDAIGKRDDEQWAWQSKAGDIGQPEWRDLVGQLDELRLVNLGHGSFDTELPRRPVLVTTGRLKGNAPDLYRDYNQRAEKAGEPTLALWDRDVLIDMLSGKADAVLRGSIDGQLLTTLGSIDEQAATMSSLELFSRRWSAWERKRLASLGVIEASLLCDRLRAGERLDLACHLAACLITSSWAAGAGDPTLAQAATAGAGLFKTYASMLWAEADDRLLREKGLVGYSGPTAWATYPLRCVRIAEILGLLCLLLEDPTWRAEGDIDPTAIAEWLVKFVTAQPGAAHPLSDRYAISLIPATLSLARADREAAKEHLKATTIWLCNRHERGELGLARTDANPAEEIERVFGGAFDFIDRERRSSSLLASVILDMCAVLGFDELYADAYNDIHAVRLIPEVLRLADAPDAYLALGAGNRIDPHVDFAETAGSPPLGPHHHDVAGQSAVNAGRAWELLAVSSALRDRYFFASLKALAARD